MCELFEQSILKIEGNQTCGHEAVKIVAGLYGSLETTISMKYMSLDAETELKRIKELDPTFDETDVFERILHPIYGKIFIY